MRVVYRSIADLEAGIGRDHGPTPWFTIDQKRIDAFAESSLDFQWIHVDPVRARSETAFGGTIAHGFLTLSLVPHFINQLRTLEDVVLGLNYGLDRVRFPAPVRVGQRMRGRAMIRDVERLEAGGVQVVTRASIEVEDSSKPGCVADLVARYFFSPIPARNQ